MRGVDLIQLIVSATGLPKDLVQAELEKIMRRSGLCAESLSIADLRKVLAEYMQDTLINAKKEYS